MPMGHENGEVPRRTSPFPCSSCRDRARRLAWRAPTAAMPAAAARASPIPAVVDVLVVVPPVPVESAAVELAADVSVSVAVAAG